MSRNRISVNGIFVLLIRSPIQHDTEHKLLEPRRLLCGLGPCFRETSLRELSAQRPSPNRPQLLPTTLRRLSTAAVKSSQKRTPDMWPGSV